jgi:hypothetical protein
MKKIIAIVLLSVPVIAAYAACPDGCEGGEVNCCTVNTYWPDPPGGVTHQYYYQGCGAEQ